MQLGCEGRQRERSVRRCDALAPGGAPLVALWLPLHRHGAMLRRWAQAPRPVETSTRLERRRRQDSAPLPDRPASGSQGVSASPRMHVSPQAREQAREALSSGSSSGAARPAKLVIRRLRGDGGVALQPGGAGRINPDGSIASKRSAGGRAAPEAQAHTARLAEDSGDDNWEDGSGSGSGPDGEEGDSEVPSLPLPRPVIALPFLVSLRPLSMGLYVATSADAFIAKSVRPSAEAPTGSSVISLRSVGSTT